MTLVEKRQQRGVHVESMRKILDKAQGERRALTVEEQQEYDRVDGEQERVGQEIAREERLIATERELGEARETGARPTPAETGEQRLVVPDRFRAMYDAAAPQLRARFELLGSLGYLRGFRGYLLDGMAGFRAVPETRDLQADLFTSGGALIPPLQVIDTLIKAIDDQVFVRPLATKQTVTMADGLGAASLDTDPADADWTTEIKTGSTDTATAFGRREMRPHPLAKRLKVSNKLMRLNPAVETLVLGRLAYKFGVTGEKAFLSGTGSQQPLGVFTASADGVTTARDVSTGNTTTAIGADGLIEAKYSVKSGYWQRGVWIFHRDAVKQIRKLKDGNGQYIWQPGLSSAQPDRILDSPFFMSEYAPNTFTTGLYVGIFGDFSYYWIVDALDLTIQRLVELYAETNQTGFIGRMETDGQPVLAEAYARVKLA